MSILVAPLLAAALLALGGALLLVTERKGERAGHAFLGALAVWAVLGLAVTMARASGGTIGSMAQTTPRVIVE